MYSEISNSTPIDEVVVLVHGLGANRLVMWPFARRLRQAGYRTVNWSYPSILGTIERHGSKLHKRMELLDADPEVAREAVQFLKQGRFTDQCRREAVAHA